MIRYEVLTDTPTADQDRTFIPRARRLSVRVAGGRARLAWTRPVAVEVRREGRLEADLRVRDWTRRIQWLLWGLGLLGAFLLHRQGRGGRGVQGQGRGSK